MGTPSRSLTWRRATAASTSSRTALRTRSSSTMATCQVQAPACTTPEARSHNLPVNTLAAQTWPAPYVRSDVCSAPGVVTNSTNGSVVHLSNPADGIYCSTTEIDLDANNYTGKITLVAPVLKVTGNHYTLNGYYQDATGLPPLTLWQGTSATDANTGPLLTLGVGTGGANNSAFNDVIWVSNGDLLYNGNSATTGFYEAWDVQVNGNSFNMTGNGPPLGGTPGTTTIVTPFSTVFTPSTVFSTIVTTIYSESTGTNITPDTTNSSTSTQTIPIPGTTQPNSTTVQTTGRSWDSTSNSSVAARLPRPRAFNSNKSSTIALPPLTSGGSGNGRYGTRA